ncbi:membrane protease YdiL (CAAX protease family) [Nocardiopsis mwathae]|uniref:Membrane protease YdiL (CAAX protease family) n=2 Tax=Nocardiopsis mwathae TaxID=1472723 RepID=A0A7W9YJG6_9ACTN|nr:membrane protease YdiL (CAAX protease family) [Nocardiopsis mwathae]
MGHTWRHRWWIPIVAFIFAAALYLLVQTIMGVAAAIIAALHGHRFSPESPLGATVPDLVFLLVTISLMTPVVMLAVRLIQRRPVGTLISVEGRMRWRWLLVCMLAALPVLAVFTAALYVLQRLTAPGEAFVADFGGGAAFIPALVAIVLLVPFQASAEEFALRGFLLQLVGGYGAEPGERRGDGAWAAFLRTPVLGIIITTAVFTSLHEYTGWGLVNVALLGAGLAWLTWYTGGLEAAIALHVLHNMLVFSISAYEGTLDAAARGPGSWEGVVGTAVEVGLFILVVVWLVRRLGIRRTAPGDAAESLPGAPPRGPAPSRPLRPRPGGPAPGLGGRGTPGAAGLSGSQGTMGGHAHPPPADPGTP